MTFEPLNRNRTIWNCLRLCSGNISGNNIFKFAVPAGLRARRNCFFTGGVVTANGICCRWLPAGASASAGRTGSPAGSQPSQALRASSPEGRGVTEGDGEGAPAPLRGAAAAAAEGPSNRRSAKNAFSEATSIFPLRPLLWDYQGRAALDSWVQRVEIAVPLPR